MRKRNKGFSLVEMVIYVTTLTLFSFLVVEALVMMSTSYRRLVAARIVSSSATVAMERITREIKKATDVDAIQSVLLVSPGRLRLNTTNDSGFAQAVTFALENGRINLYENDLLIGPLTSSRASTTNLVFRLQNGSKSKMVGVEMTVRGESGGHTREESFQTSIIMRNSI